MKPKDLVGEHELTGVDTGILRADPTSEDYSRYEDANTLLFVLDGKTYKAIEDPSDGYRSSMRDIQEVSDEAVANRFQPVRVVAQYVDHIDSRWSREECDLLRLIDAANGLVVLEVGTRNTDDYYPCFIADFKPQNMACNQPVGGRGRSPSWDPGTLSTRDK